MISFVRGPGGPFARLLSEFVPFLLGLTVGGVAIVFVSPLSAALIGAAAWPLASAILRGVRRHTRLRRLYRVAALAHVVFWSVQAVLLTAQAPAGPAEVVGVAAWAQPTALQAGYGEAPFALPEGTSLGGWGSRPRRIRLAPFGGAGVLGRHGQAWMAAPAHAGRPRMPMFATPTQTTSGVAGALGARALVLRAAADVAPPVAIVRLDLVTADAALHAAIAAGVSSLGIPPEGLLVAATHTHSGPGGYSPNPLSALFGTDHLDPPVRDAIVAAAVAALERAHGSAEPARLALVASRDRDPATGLPVLARNRRDADENAIDDRVYGLRVDAIAGDRPLAVVVNYATHPLLYRRRHMAFDRDLAGGIEEALRARLQGQPPVLYLNGAQGDVSARHGGGEPAARIAALAEAFAARVAPAFEAARGTGATQVRLAAARVERRLATPRAYHTALGTRAGVLEALDRSLLDLDPAATAADVLALPVNLAVWSLGIPEARVGFTWSGDVGAALQLEPAMGNPATIFAAWVLELGDGADAPRVALLAQPGEAMIAVGRAWRALARERGLPDTLIVGLANDARAYVVPDGAYDLDGYEAGSTLFGPHTGSDVTAALAAALDAALAPLAR